MDASEPNSPDDLSPDDPLILELVEEEVAAYRDLLPPEALEELRRTLVLATLSHPYPQALVRQLKKTAAVQKSGTRAAGEPAEPENAGADSAKSSGKGRS
jgi:hypothetical protein